MFKLKKIDIDVSSEAIALINVRAARILQVYANDRVEICPTSAPERCIISVLNVLQKNATESIDGEVELKEDEIGLYSTAFERLGMPEGESITIKPLSRPESFDVVKRKMEEGYLFTEQDLLSIIRDIVYNRYPQSLITYFLIACAEKGLDDDETAYLTRALVDTGRVLKFDSHLVADKHCIGGIPGNRTTPIVVAIAAAAGIRIPNTFTRSITSPSGTADTLETYLKVDLSLPQMERMVEKVGGCLVWGGAISMAPADDIIIRVEHPLNIDSESQMIASILAKKIAAGNTHFLLDIPMGPQAKVKNQEKAEHLKSRFEIVAGKLGLNMKVIITDGSQPVGNGIGPILEMIDILKVLDQAPDAPRDLRNRSLMLAGNLLEFVGKAKAGSGEQMATDILSNGDAKRKFEEIRMYQGAIELKPLSEKFIDIPSVQAGTVQSIHNKIIVSAAKLAGAPLDPTAGVYLYKHVGDAVAAAEPILRLYSGSETRLEEARKFVVENNTGYEIIQ